MEQGVQVTGLNVVVGGDESDVLVQFLAQSVDSLNVKGRSLKAFLEILSKIVKRSWFSSNKAVGVWNAKQFA